MKKTVTLNDKTFEVMIPAHEIDRAVAAVAERLNADYGDKERPIFVGVLNGAFMFLSDLIKKIDFTCEISFVKLASYEGTCSTGNVECLLGLNNDIAGRHVIIVEDIVDSGNTLCALKELFQKRGAKSVRCCCLLDKKERREAPIEADYVGFDVPDKFLVGYGLDYAGKYRNLKFVGTLKPEIYRV
mgnify:CR=1 FL=1